MLVRLPKAAVQRLQQDFLQGGNGWYSISLLRFPSCFPSVWCGPTFLALSPSISHLAYSLIISNKKLGNRLLHGCSKGHSIWWKQFWADKLAMWSLCHPLTIVPTSKPCWTWADRLPVSALSTWVEFHLAGRITFFLACSTQKSGP